MSVTADTITSNYTNTPAEESFKPMLESRNASRSTYSKRMRAIERWSKCKWLTLLSVIILVLVALTAGVLFLIANSLSVPLEDQKAKEITPAEEVVYKFEYQTDTKKKEDVVINIKMNFTEMFAEDMTVYNHFSKAVSIYKVAIGHDGLDMNVCLVKHMSREVPPMQLKQTLAKTKEISVNASELYVISNSTPPAAVLSDMRVLQYCYKSKVYMLEPATRQNQLGSFTMEQLLTEAQDILSLYGRRKRDVEPLHPLDKHNSPPYYCGGPIGTGQDVNVQPRQYTCSRSKEYCYKSLVNEQCEECYHGHYLRTKGCWCPIKAVQTCVRISYKPDLRSCCTIDASPCSRNECESMRIPEIPIPVITFRISEAI